MSTRVPLFQPLKDGILAADTIHYHIQMLQGDIDREGYLRKEKTGTKNSFGSFLFAGCDRVAPFYTGEAQGLAARCWEWLSRMWSRRLDYPKAGAGSRAAVPILSHLRPESSRFISLRTMRGSLVNLWA